MRIREWKIRKILNSKGEETVEVEINGFRGSAPSGTSRSSFEVDPFPPEGVKRSILELRRFFENIKGDADPLELEQQLIEMRDKIGGNGVVATAIALYKAEAYEWEMLLWKYLSEKFHMKPSLPKPLENVVGGGKHGGYTDIQEFLVFPEKGNPSKWIFELAEVYRSIKSSCLTLESAKSLEKRTEEILSLLSSYEVGLGVDVAATEMFKEGVYMWRKEGVIRDREAQMDYIEELVRTFNLYYIEDPLEENDVEGFIELQRRLKESIVVGDDLFSTHKERLRKGIGGIIIKYNQRGSILETIETIKEAKKLGMKIIVSHRSGETEDEFLSHFAVGVGSDFAKVGAAGIRIVKLNELLRIYESFE